MKKYRSLLCSALLMMAHGGFAEAGEQPFSIQRAIDEAQIGTAIEIPPGIYQEALVMKEGIALIGAGAGQTIIDGGGASQVIRGGKDSLIIGCTIQNGEIGIRNEQNQLSVFECYIRAYQRCGIQIHQGFAVIGHNVIEGQNGTTGILCMNSNPYIFNNTIINNQQGLLVWGHHKPNVFENHLIANKTGVYVGKDARVILAENTFQNEKNSVGQSLSPSDMVGPTTESFESHVPYQGGRIGSYQKLIKLISKNMLGEHPVVIYKLGDQLGAFGMATLFPWATFSVAASREETKIVHYDAYDGYTEEDLYAEYQAGHRATIHVKNPTQLAQETDRYVLDTLYLDEGSYFQNELGQRVFRRLTNLSRIEILLPEGYVLQSINYPAEVEVLDGQIVVKITDVGNTLIEMVLEKE